MVVTKRKRFKLFGFTIWEREIEIEAPDYNTPKRFSDKVRDMTNGLMILHEEEKELDEKAERLAQGA